MSSGHINPIFEGDDKGMFSAEIIGKGLSEKKTSEHQPRLSTKFLIAACMRLSLWLASHIKR